MHPIQHRVCAATWNSACSHSDADDRSQPGSPTTAPAHQRPLAHRLGFGCFRSVAGMAFHFTDRFHDDTSRAMRPTASARSGNPDFGAIFSRGPNTVSGFRLPASSSISPPSAARKFDRIRHPSASGDQGLGCDPFPIALRRLRSHRPGSFASPGNRSWRLFRVQRFTCQPIETSRHSRQDTPWLDTFRQHYSIPSVG